MPRRAPVSLALVVALGGGALAALPATATTTAVPTAMRVPAAAALLDVQQPAEGLLPGSPVHLTGRLAARDTTTGRVLGALPSTYKVRVTTEDHTVFRTFGPFRSLDGSVDVTLPGSATEGVTPTAWTDDAVDVAVSVFDVTPLTGGKALPGVAGATAATVATPKNGLSLVNDFTSHLGWVKPGDTFPLRLFVRNATSTARSGAVVTLRGVDGMTLTTARDGSRAVSVKGNRLTWNVGTVAKGTTRTPATRTLVVTAHVDSLRQDPRIVWKNLSSTATLTWKGGKTASTSHGPKVIPPSGAYDTARYGDRPFPVVAVDYVDRAHRTANNGTKIARTINDPKYKGSTFSLFQEMSLGQLYPNGTVASAGIATREVSAADRLKFSVPAPGGTCRGVTQVNPLDGTPLPTYTTRIKDGWYQLPGTTDYYGDDKYGSGLVGAIAGVGAIFDIDGACGPSAKAAYDAAVVADPDVDYNDYDTDKDGVVDFFEVIFVGLGGHGVSQGAGCGPDNLTDPDTCPLGENPPIPSYDNIWPHSSTLEASYTDAATGLAGYVSHDQLKDLTGRPMYYTSAARTSLTTRKTAWKAYVRVGPYNVNPESSLAKASVISHEYGHSLGLPDFYSLGSRETYGDWNLMATDKSQSMDVFSRQEMGWVVPVEIPAGTSTVKGWKDSKVDTHAIRWIGGNGKPYTLTGPTVHNAMAYTAKLPTKKLIDPRKLAAASPTHTWWSESGNDFGCPADGGHNLDIHLPQLKKVAAGTKVTVSFKSYWDIEWDYDYAFVMTGKPNSKGVIETYTSHASTNGYTTPSQLNPNANSCQQKYGNGLTGTSASAAAGTQIPDRATGEYADSTFIADSYDISDLAGSDGVLRFSYATDPGLARPGWFIDDVVVKAGTKVVYSSTFEKDKGPASPYVFNGGCKEGSAVAAKCTRGWQYVNSAVGSSADRGYYLEMRDRSGFDFNGKGQNDRGAIGFQPGLLLTYTDETHGYGNSGTDDPPAQSPLDANPQKGENAPKLNDAAFKQGDGYSDIKGHTDNYLDPTSESGNWEFRYNCLAFTVRSMSGEDVGPDSATGRGGDLRGDVSFTRNRGCAKLDYGYRTVGGQKSSAIAGNHAPEAKAETKPVAGKPGVMTLSGLLSRDDFTAASDLTYAWDTNGDGVTDVTGSTVRAAVAKDAPVSLTVTDAEGLSTKVQVLAGRKVAVGGVTSGTPIGQAGPGRGDLPRPGTTVTAADEQRDGSSTGPWAALALGLVLAAGAGVALARRS
jgi:hypothetical protein